MRTTLEADIVTAALDMAVAQARLGPVSWTTATAAASTPASCSGPLPGGGDHAPDGTVSDAYHNAMAESFFATLECELIDREIFPTREQARTKIFDYLETWYNPRRRHSSIDYLSPMEYQRRCEAALAAPSV